MKHTKQPAPAPSAQQAAQALYNALSLCRKAGKLVMGYDAVVEAALTGKAACVLTAADVSPKTAQRLAWALEGAAQAAPLPLTQDDLAPIARKRVAVYAIADPNLARLCEEKRRQCMDLIHLEAKEEVSE